MKVVFLFSLLFAAVIAWLSWKPEYATQLAQEIGESAMTAMYERDVRIEGGEENLQKEVFSKIKRSGSNIALRFAPEDVEKKILSIPSVQSVTITPCSRFSWDCFKVVLIERVPYYQIYKKGMARNAAWLASKDGSYLQSGDACAECIPVIGLEAMTGESSEGAQRSLAKLSLFLVALKEIAQCGVVRVEFLSSQELMLTLNGCAQWRALFSFPYEESVYSKELLRFKEVLGQFAGREQLVKKVEMSYDKMAVVSLQEGVSLASPSPTPKAKSVKAAPTIQRKKP